MGQELLQLTALEWTVRATPSGPSWNLVPPAVRTRVSAGIPAQVPGVVHTDLMAAGLLDDPYLGLNERDQQWVGAQTWTYTCVFGLGDDSPEIEAENVDLLCDGLDTVAEVLVNGLPVGRSVNMHRRNVFPIRSLLRVGLNQLEVVFSPALEYIEQMKSMLGARPLTSGGGRRSGRTSSRSRGCGSDRWRGSRAGTRGGSRSRRRGASRGRPTG